MQVNDFIITEVLSRSRVSVTGLVIIHPEFLSALLYLVWYPGRLTTVKGIFQAPSPTLL